MARSFPVRNLLVQTALGNWSKPIPRVDSGLGTSNMPSFALPYQLPPILETASSFTGSMLPSASKTASLICILSTSQITRFPAPPSVPKETTSFTLHSNCTGDSATLGGLMVCEAKGVNPAFSNSLTPLPYSVLERDICCTIS